MAWERPTIEQLIEESVTDTESRLEGGSARLRRKTLNAVAASRAGALHGVHGRLETMAKDMLPVKGCSFETTLKWAGFFKMPRKLATHARAAWKCSGNNGAVVQAGQVLQRDDGVEYTTDEEVTLADGTASIPITAVVSGAAGNAAEGRLLTLVTPVEGVQPTGNLSAAATGGNDLEAEEDFHERVSERMALQMTGSNDAIYVMWAKEVPGVTRALCFPRIMGRGTVGVTFVCDRQEGSFIPSPEKVAEVDAYIESHEDPATGQMTGRSVTAEVWTFAPAEKPSTPGSPLRRTPRPFVRP